MRNEKIQMKFLEEILIVWFNIFLVRIVFWCGSMYFSTYYFWCGRNCFLMRFPHDFFGVVLGNRIKKCFNDVILGNLTNKAVL